MVVVLVLFLPEREWINHAANTILFHMSVYPSGI